MADAVIIPVDDKVVVATVTGEKLDREKPSKLLSKAIDPMLWVHTVFTAFVTYDLTSRYASVDRCPISVLPPFQPNMTSSRPILLLPLQISKQPNFLLTSGIIQAALPLLVRLLFYRTDRVQTLTPARIVFNCFFFFCLCWDEILFLNVLKSLARACSGTDGKGSLGDAWASGSLTLPILFTLVYMSFLSANFTPSGKGQGQGQDRVKGRRLQEEEEIQIQEIQFDKKSDFEQPNNKSIWSTLYPYHLLFTVWVTYDLTTRYACVGRGINASILNATTSDSNSNSSDVLIIQSGAAEGLSTSSSLDSLLSDWILPPEISSQRTMILLYGVLQALIVPVVFDFDFDFSSRRPSGHRVLFLLLLLVWNVLEFCAVHGAVGKACPADPNSNAFGTWYATALVTVVYVWALVRFTGPMTELEIPERQQGYQP